MAILVTGGAGFIGSHLVSRLLQTDQRIVIIDNLNDYYDPEIKRNNIEQLQAAVGSKPLVVTEADIRDVEAVSALFKKYDFSAVYHLAAMAGVRFSIERPHLYFDVNVNGTVNLLENAAKRGKPKFIFASSSSVYGGSPHVPFTEKDPVNYPVSPYAASKKSGEVICHTYHHLHDLDITCLRFFTVYGPNQRPEMAIHRFTRRILQGLSVPMFGDGSTSRDYTYIDDIIDGVIAAGERCDGYNIFNLGNSSPVKLATLIELISKALGVVPVIEELPLPAGDVVRTWADISHSARHLGYNPRVSIEEGLERFVKWFKANRR